MLYFTWICKWLEKNTHFRLWKIQNGGKKNKMLLNLYTSLLDFFGVLMKFDRKLSRQGEIQLADSQHSDGHFPVCQLGVEPLQHVITSYCRLANIYWLWHISTAGHLLANPDLGLNIHVIYLYWQVQTKHDCDGNQKYHLSKSHLLPESILFSRSNITI